MKKTLYKFIQHFGDFISLTGHVGFPIPCKNIFLQVLMIQSMYEKLKIVKMTKSWDDPSQFLFFFQMNPSLIIVGVISGIPTTLPIFWRIEPLEFWILESGRPVPLMKNRLSGSMLHKI